MPRRDETDITREQHVHQGFIDYVFKIENRPIFVLEAKSVGNFFVIPKALKKRRYRIDGAISTDNRIKNAINQVQKYSAEMGATFSIISNGHQFIVFESFKHFGKWRSGFCLVFRSFEDIENNFTFFVNVLSKQSVMGGSLKKLVCEEVAPLEFSRPLENVHNEDVTVGRNVLAPRLTPIIEYIFKDITADSQLEVLRHCYVPQQQTSDTNNAMIASFDRLPHYAKKYNIGWFRESKTDSGDFQLNFEKCIQFLKKEAPLGTVIMLLGGIGSGKTTFISARTDLTKTRFMNSIIGSCEEELSFIKGRLGL